MPAPKQPLSITIHQPFASLIAWGVKRYETRSWATPYRGDLVIHAGLNHEWMRDLTPTLRRLILERRAFHPHDAETPFGYALCVVRLVDCIQMSSAFIAAQTEQERAVGLWHPGRFAWQFDNLRPIEWVEIRGKQGMWPWPASIPLKEKHA